MKTVLYIILIILSSVTIYCQNFEVEGKARIDQMDQTMNTDSVVVRLSDGTLGVLPVMNLPFLKFPPEGAYFYLDGDNDGFGLESQPVWVPLGISPPSMYIGQHGDCDDSIGTINPNAVEDCCDEIDNDCDGVIDVDENCPPKKPNGSPCIQNCDCISDNCSTNICQD